MYFSDKQATNQSPTRAQTEQSVPTALGQFFAERWNSVMALGKQIFLSTPNGLMDIPADCTGEILGRSDPESGLQLGNTSRFFRDQIDNKFKFWQAKGYTDRTSYLAARKEHLKKNIPLFRAFYKFLTDVPYHEPVIHPFHVFMVGDNDMKTFIDQSESKFISSVDEPVLVQIGKSWLSLNRKMVAREFRQGPLAISKDKAIIYFPKDQKHLQELVNEIRLILPFSPPLISFVVPPSDVSIDVSMINVPGVCYLLKLSDAFNSEGLSGFLSWFKHPVETRSQFLEIFQKNLSLLSKLSETQDAQMTQKLMGSFRALFPRHPSDYVVRSLPSLIREVSDTSMSIILGDLARWHLSKQIVDTLRQCAEQYCYYRALIEKPVPALSEADEKPAPEKIQSGPSSNF